MKEKKFRTRAPFGVATKRFSQIGFHPGLDPSLKRDISQVCPQTYNPKPIGCKSKTGVDWKRKAEIEEFSKYLGFKNNALLAERKFRKSLGGPGFSDISEDIFKKKYFSVFNNNMCGTNERFKDTSNNNPPPGTYTRKIVRDCQLEKKYFTNKPTFDWDGFVERFKDQAPSFSKPPNLYKNIDTGGISYTLKKVVSKRGPYDLFTGPRDSSTLKGYLAPRIDETPETFHVPLSSYEEMLKKKRYGLFLKELRFPKKPYIKSMLEDISLCYKDPNHPGPTHYNVEHFNSIVKKPESLHPFNVSKLYARPPTDWTIHPAVGRYYPRQIKCLKLKRPSWVFLTKAPRNFFTPKEEYNLF